MTDSPNELTTENSALVFIDHQPWVASSVHSIRRHDRGLSHYLEVVAAEARRLGRQSRPPRAVRQAVARQSRTAGSH
jgi:hypothetical protein